jgi:hypothetical protein
VKPTVEKEKWIELAKKLRDRTQAYFKPDQLETIDEFIRHAGAQFDQITQ